jgi:hypothetical protein
VVSATLGEATANNILVESGVDDLPDELPSGPRDLEALARELQPFVDLYRVLLKHTDREMALQIMRRAIIESGAVSHASDATPSQPPPAGGGDVRPLNLTSPPPEGFVMSDGDMQESFKLAMAYFSCEGELLAYSPERVRFRVTSCNWCKAMQNAGAPELIAFICETDERFMDNHPTHRLRRPTAIGLGDDFCDFQFVPAENLKNFANESGDASDWRGGFSRSSLVS